MKFIKEKTSSKEGGRRGGKDNKKSRKMLYNPYKKKIEKIYTTNKNENTQLSQSQIEYYKTSEEDKKWYGDDLTCKPQKHETRFMFLNCNGLSRAEDTNWFKSQITRIIQKDVHYISLAEINVNTHNKVLRNRLLQAYSEVLPDGILNLNNTNTRDSKAEYQPGGVAGGFFGKIRNRYKKTKYDPGGRWICHQFEGKTRKLRVYSFYRVNNGGKGIYTAWLQQKNYLMEKFIEENPRKQAILDMIEEIQDAINRNFDIILMSDLNEAIDGIEKSNEKIKDLGLYNLYESSLGVLPRTYFRGTKMIDHVWVTPGVLDHIKRVGVAPFNYTIFSDHRALLFDVDINKILEEEDINLTPAKLRRLKSSNPERVKKYNIKLNQLWTKHKIQDKYEKLMDMSSTKGVDIESELNKLDNQITEIMRCSEKKCAYTGQNTKIPWSPKLHQAIVTIRNLKKQKKEMSRKRTTDMRKHEYDEISKKLKMEQEHYKEIKANSKMHREDHLLQRAQELAGASAPMKHLSKLVANIKYYEGQAEKFARINKVLRRDKFFGLNKVMIPDKCEYGITDQNFNEYDINIIWNRLKEKNGKDVKRWKVVTDPNLIEHLLVNWQRMHFSQALGSPLTSPDFQTKIKNENTQAQILEGKFKTSEQLPQESMDYISCIRKNPLIKKHITPKTSIEDFKLFIHKSSEKRSCSPSGRHYGHYKALLTGNPKKLEIIHGIFQLALTHKIVLKRWANTVTTLIEKDDNLPYIHRMRSIHIVEAELQFFSKLIYVKKMMSEVERLNLITEEQYGGRSRRQALMVVVNKIMYYSITNQTLIPAAYMDDDARACYDRIIPSVAALESQKWGIRNDTANLTTKIIQHQKFHIRTNNGISREYYKYEDNKPIFGTGQGLGWSGAIWTNTSDTINSLIKKNCAGMKFSDPNGEIVVHKYSDMFVDDTATGTNKRALTSTSSVSEQIQRDEQLHAFYLYSAGHLLAVDKCQWYNIDFKRNGINHHMIKNEELDGSVKIKPTFTSDPVEIKRLQPSQAHRTLGHFLAPDGNHNKQKQVIQDMIDKWIKLVEPSHLPNDEKLMAYKNYLVPALKYKLISTNMTYRECEHLEKKLSPIIFNAHGIQRNCHRAPLYSSSKYLGMNIQHIYHMQGIEKLQLFLMLIRRAESEAALLEISMRYTQLELGLPQHFFTYNYDKCCNYITPTWITHIWSYVDSCGATLKFTNPYKYDLPRENDFFLMEALINESKIDIVNIRIFNQIRIHLRLISASDIIQYTSSTKIVDYIWNGKNFRTSKIKWPWTKNFPKQWIGIWQSILRNIILPKIQTRPLGRWKKKSHQEWKYAYDNKNNSIKKRKHILHEDYFSIDYDPHKNMMYGNKFKINPMKTKTNTPNSYKDIIETTPTWTKNNWGRTPTTKEINKLIDLIKNKQCVAVSDGTVNAGIGAHSWCFADTITGNKVMTGAALVNGIPNKLNSFRSEAFGIIAILSICELTQQIQPQISGSIDIYCDNKSILEKASKDVENLTKYSLENDADTTLQIRAILNKLRIRVSFHHVKGHQDEKKRNEELNIQEKLNCDMDKMANTYLAQHKSKSSNVYPQMESQRVHIIIDGRNCVTDIKANLIDRFYRREIEQYLRNKLNISSENTDIDWNRMDKYLRNNHRNIGKISKIIHNQINTFKVCYRWGTSDTPLCPNCSIEDETIEHIFRCPNSLMQTVRNDGIRDVMKIMTNLKTDPQLLNVIHMILTSFATDYPIKFPPLHAHPKSMHIQQLLKSQKNIGWLNFHKGLVSTKFGEIQAFYYKQIKAHKTLNVDRWNNSLLSALLDYSRKLWRHRCNIVSINDEMTLERRIRKETKEKYQIFKSKLWKFRNQDRELLTRGKDFFDTAPFHAITFWSNQLEIATANAAYQAAKETQDIRQFFKKHKSRNPYHSGRPVSRLKPTQIPLKTKKITDIFQLKKNKKKKDDHTETEKKTFEQHRKIPSTTQRKRICERAGNTKIHKWLLLHSIRYKSDVEHTKENEEKP